MKDRCEDGKEKEIEEENCRRKEKGEDEERED